MSAAPLPLPAALAALRREGAWRLDPARFHWLEALARRLPGQPEAVRRLLQSKVEAALADYARRWREAPADNVRPLRRSDAPAAACEPLAQLNRSIRGLRAQDALPAGEPQPPDELASVRRFRRAWSASRSQQQVAQAALRKPANAGPLNSHALVLDSLELMGELSPDYLRRFLLHAESLQWLEQAAPPRAAPAGKGKPAKGAGMRRRRGGT